MTDKDGNGAVLGRISIGSNLTSLGLGMISHS
jgi:hypothetical protein